MTIKVTIYIFLQLNHICVILLEYLSASLRKVHDSILPEFWGYLELKHISDCWMPLTVPGVPEQTPT